jgi:hypothetical protein
LKANATVHDIVWELWPGERRNSSMIFDKIWWLRRKRNRLNRVGMSRIIQLAQNATDQKEIWAVIHKEWSGYQANEEEMLHYRSKLLMNEAEHLGLPVPRGDDKFDTGLISKGLHYLKVEVQAQLRKDIRQEKKERRETVTAIVKDVISPLGSLIISILSLMIAYAALKLKH